MTRRTVPVPALQVGGMVERYLTGFGRENQLLGRLFVLRSRRGGPKQGDGKYYRAHRTEMIAGVGLPCRGIQTGRITADRNGGFQWPGEGFGFEG